MPTCSSTFLRLPRPVAVVPARLLQRVPPHVRHRRRDPDRGRAEALDVVQLVDDPLEVAARVLVAVGRIELALVLVVVRRVAVGEAVGHHEVDDLLLPGGRGDVEQSSVRRAGRRRCPTTTSTRAPRGRPRATTPSDEPRSSGEPPRGRPPVPPAIYAEAGPGARDQHVGAEMSARRAPDSGPIRTDCVGSGTIKVLLVGALRARCGPHGHARCRDALRRCSRVLRLVRSVVDWYGGLFAPSARPSRRSPPGCSSPAPPERVWGVAQVLRGGAVPPGDLARGSRLRPRALRGREDPRRGHRPLRLRGRVRPQAHHLGRATERAPLRGVRAEARARAVPVARAMASTRSGPFPAAPRWR